MHQAESKTQPGARTKQSTAVSIVSVTDAKFGQVTENQEQIEQSIAETGQQ